MKCRLLILPVLLLTLLSCSKDNKSENSGGQPVSGETTKNYDIVVATDIKGLDEVCFGKNGELIALKNIASGEEHGKGYMLLPDTKTGLDEFYAVFDRNGMPEKIYINGMSADVISYHEGMVDVAVNFGDTLNVLINSLNVEMVTSGTKAFSDNSWVRNSCAIAKAVTGVIETGSGAVMIAVSGTSIPLTNVVEVAGTAAGIGVVADGSNNIQQTWNTLLSPATETYKGSLIDPAVATGMNYFQDALNNKLMSLGTKEQERIFNETKVFRSMNAGDLKNAGNVLSYISLGIDWIDYMFGETTNEYDSILRKYRGFSVVTGVVKGKDKHSATLSAYVGPDIYSRTTHAEWGLIINGSDGYHNHYDAFEEGCFDVEFKGLKSGSTYICQAYYSDKDNGLSFFGLPLGFVTEKTCPAKITSFEQLNSEAGNFSYNGGTYKYKFTCKITVSSGDNSTALEDWGYVYRDKDGNEMKVSLYGKSSPYEAKFNIYENEAQTEACLFAYAKYKDEEFLYADPAYYDLCYGECPDGSHPHAIDLGLSVKWACCNVGASKPEEYGGYYAWGEMSEKSEYGYATYKYWKDGCYIDDEYYRSGFTKYVSDSHSGFGGFTDGKTVLDLVDDVAHVKWGGSWRMPTHAEFKELVSNCTSKWTELNGVKGRRFTSKINGNSIFLPASGCMDYMDLYNVGSAGGYRSSSLDTDNDYRVWGLYFYSDLVYTSSIYGRYFGLSVRPVSE